MCVPRNLHGKDGVAVRHVKHQGPSPDDLARVPELPAIGYVWTCTARSSREGGEGRRGRGGWGGGVQYVVVGERFVVVGILQDAMRWRRHHHDGARGGGFRPLHTQALTHSPIHDFAHPTVSSPMHP